MRTVISVFLFITSISSPLYSAGNRCQVFDKLSDSHVSGHSLRQLVSETCGRSGCSVDDADEIYERANRHVRTERVKFSGRDAHHRENEQVTSIVKDLKLNKEQQRRLHDEITQNNLSRKEILERARDLFGK